MISSKINALPTRLRVLFAAALLGFPVFSTAAEKTAGHVRAALVAEDLRAPAGGTSWVGIRLTMAPGWHTYWKNPGDSGMATRIRWALPSVVTAGDILWPAPGRIVLPPLVSFGYEKETLLLVPLQIAPGASGPVKLSARVDWLECSDVCVPGRADLELRLNVGSKTQPNPAVADLFARYRNRLPRTPEGWTLEANRSGKSVKVTLQPPPGENISSKAFTLFPEDEDTAEAGAVPAAVLRDGKITVEFPSETKRVQAVLVAADGPGAIAAYALDLPVTQGPATAPLGWILLLAFAGGLLLNLMPCVLPVLSLKAFGFLKDAGLDAASRRRQGLLYAAGVVVSFWALAGVLLALRAGGQGLGWGFHLQSPRFVLVLIGLFVLLAANLWGFFEVGGRLVGVAAERGRSWGAFGGGVLATVVATPCTAPFMGTAIGVALAQPVPVALAVFTSLALGMAFPYWLLTVVPAAGRWLPRPGPWMGRVKIVLGFFLLATAGWLLWVLYRQSPAAVGPAAALGAALGVAAWAYGQKQRGLRFRWSATTLAAVLAMGAWAWMAAGTGAVSSSESGLWETYSPERVAQLEKEGRPYFIDFTATWCLTCQVNKKTTLEKPETLALFRESNVALLRADWTNRDETIARALAGWGRSGVPLYVLKGRGAPALLPALLTPGLVRDALLKMKEEVS